MRSRPLEPVTRLSLSLLGCTIVVVGCLSHTDAVRIGSSPDGTTSLSSDELRSAMSVVERVAKANGLVPDPGLDWMGPSSEHSKEIDNVVVALYMVDPESEGTEWIDLRIGVAKSSGEVVVMVTDLNSHSASEFARNLTAEIRGALDLRFPDRPVRVDRRTNLPSLGP